MFRKYSSFTCQVLSGYEPFPGHGTAHERYVLYLYHFQVLNVPQLSTLFCLGKLHSYFLYMIHQIYKRLALLGHYYFSDETLKIMVIKIPKYLKSTWYTIFLLFSPWLHWKPQYRFSKHLLQMWMEWSNQAKECGQGTSKQWMLNRKYWHYACSNYTVASNNSPTEGIWMNILDTLPSFNYK